MVVQKVLLHYGSKIVLWICSAFADHLAFFPERPHYYCYIYFHCSYLLTIEEEVWWLICVLLTFKRIIRFSRDIWEFWWSTVISIRQYEFLTSKFRSFNLMSETLKNCSQLVVFRGKKATQQGSGDPIVNWLGMYTKSYGMSQRSCLLSPTLCLHHLWPAISSCLLLQCLWSSHSPNHYIHINTCSNF
jgi:hypothetical protein